MSGAVIGCALLWLLLPVAAHGQAPGLNEMALQWARGRYASPVICDIEGEPISGVRRLLIAPGPRHSLPPVARVLFSDLEVDGAARCFDSLGRAQPNVEGSVEFRLTKRSRPDLAQREFSTALRRDRGFDFDITKGILRITTVGVGSEPADVDFTGGQALLHTVAKGSDTERLLSPFPTPRRLLLILKSKDGEREIRLPLFMTAPR